MLQSQKALGIGDTLSPRGWVLSACDPRRQQTSSLRTRGAPPGFAQIVSAGGVGASAFRVGYAALGAGTLDVTVEIARPTAPDCSTTPAACNATLGRPTSATGCATTPSARPALRSTSRALERDRRHSTWPPTRSPKRRSPTTSAARWGLPARLTRSPSDTRSPRCGLAGFRCVYGCCAGCTLGRHSCLAHIDILATTTMRPRKQTIARSAVTGRIVTKKYAATHPKTTVVQKVTIPPKQKS